MQGQARPLSLQDVPMASSGLKQLCYAAIGVLGSAYRLPNMDEKSHRVLCPATTIGLSCWMTRCDINGIETGHSFPTGQEMRYNVHLAQLRVIHWA